jgi:hypothetical protein
MRQYDPARPPAASGQGGDFVVYLEGAADRAIVGEWCKRLLPGLASSLTRSVVILGGRQPARALEHFRALGGAESGKRALCVLDRDDGLSGEPDSDEEGLEFFTWGRRHIESYLLVPDAIRRGMGLPETDGRVARLLRKHIPPRGDDEAWRDLDAKRLLGRSGPLVRSLGAPVPLARVARATRESELHEDVHACFSQLRRLLGIVEATVVR